MVLLDVRLSARNVEQNCEAELDQF